MAEPEIKIADIIIDCVDPFALASFWAELLARPVAWNSGPYVWLQPAPNGMGLGFQKVNEPKTGKNRVHVDIAVDDVAATKRRIESLGGRRVDGFERGGFLVMADPEGNEFCVMPSAKFDVDEHGRATYLDDLES